MTTPFDLQLAHAACALVQQITPAIVPQFSLAAASTVGATTLTAPTGTNLLVLGFRPGGIISFWDDSGEQPLAIAPGGVAANVLTLDFSGQPFTGIQHAHALGSIIATNLLDSPPLDTFIMRGSGPVISCFVLDEELTVEATQQFRVAVNPLSFVYEINDIQPPGTQLNAQLWSRQQLHRATSDVATIVAAIANNHKFNTTSAGQLTISVSRLAKSLRRVEDTDTIHHYQLTLEVETRTIQPFSP